MENKKMWARVGVSIEMTEEEYKTFIRNSQGNDDARAVAEDWLRKKLESGKGVELSGETYFPRCEYLSGTDTSNEEDELEFLF